MLWPEQAAANGAVIEYDEAAQTPYFRYDNDGHEVWFEDARSIAAKWNLAREFGLSGVRYWNLMQEFPKGFNLSRKGRQNASCIG